MIVLVVAFLCLCSSVSTDGSEIYIIVEKIEMKSSSCSILFVNDG